METIALFMGVVLIVVLALKGVPIFFSAIITSIFILVTAGMDIVGGLTDIYSGAFAGFIKNNLFIFVFGSIFGKILDLSGAANSIADFAVGKLGEKAIIPSIIIAGGIMGYGGISVFVGLFALYPLIFAMFKKADISRTLVPGIYCAAAGSFTVWMPGSPAIQNLIPAEAFGTSTFAAAIPGFIAAVIQIVLEILVCQWFVKYTKKKGMGWESDGDALLSNDVIEKKYPPIYIALLPMIILICILGFAKINSALGLAIGIFSSMIIYAKYLPFNDTFWGHLQTGFMGGITALVATASVVGFGGIIQQTPAFNDLIGNVVGSKSNPLMTSVAMTSILAGISGSGTGGLAMSIPIIKEYFLPMGINTEALVRALALSTMIFTLPSNSVVNTAITAAKSTHKDSYPLIFITVSVMSLISMIILFILYSIMGMM